MFWKTRGRWPNRTNNDFVWGTHRPPGDQDFVEVSLAEVREAVKAMPLASAPGLGHIPVVVLRKNLFILAPWLQLYLLSLALPLVLSS